MRLSDSIEQFIKDLLSQEPAEVELKRNELAEYFGCAPSQINYVLATRFSPDHGYLTESRRGGGGYIRIVRVVESGPQRLMYLVNDRIGDSLSEEECQRLISQLKDQRIVTPDEAALMASSVSTRALSVPVPDTLKNAMRAKMMKSMLMTIAARNRG
jgi:transcriptional regulator CtsR